MKKAILLILLLPMLASAQYFEVFDIDTTDYPIMKAKFYSADANGNQILNHTPADFQITENGEPRDVIRVSCPIPRDEPFSVVIAVDVSGSMSGESIKNAKESIKILIDMIPNNGSEVAIIAFNSGNYYISDFTTNKSQLKVKVENLKADGGADFNAAFINPMAGALLAIDKAKHKLKGVLIVTDGYASGNETEIINQAKNQNTKIYSILIGKTAPKILSNISNSSNGKTYENIITESDFNEAFIQILYDLIQEPCEIYWRSDISCESLIGVSILNNATSKSEKEYYQKSGIRTARIEIDSYFINFGQLNKDEFKDTSVIITAKNYDQVISNFNFEPNQGYFEVLNSLPLVIKRNNTATLNIRYTAIDIIKKYSTLILTSNYCDSNIGLLAGSKSGQIQQRTLELTHPNGGEVFDAGSDTSITWKGITDKEKVQLNFSTNSGRNWSIIELSTYNSTYEWKVPNVESDSCLVAIDYFDNIDRNIYSNQVEWFSKFGGSQEEEAKEVIVTLDGGYLLSGSTSSNDLDMNQNLPNTQSAFLIKVGKSGDLKWIKTYGDSNSNILESITQTADSGFVFVGNVNNLQNHSRDLWIVKVDSSGEMEWSKEYGGSYYDSGLSVKETSDRSLIVSGYSGSDDGDLINNSNSGESDVWVLKLNKFGNIVWSKTFGGDKEEYSNSIIQTNEGGYILTGISHSKNALFGYQLSTEEDVFVLKLNANGEIEWNLNFGGFSTDYSNSIIQSRNGDYIVVGGRLDINGNGLDGFFQSIDVTGKAKNFKQFGGSKIDMFMSIIEIENNEFMIAGISSSNDYDLVNIGNKGKLDLLLLTVDDKGRTLWSKTIGGTKDDRLFSIAANSDNEYVISGTIRSEDYDLKEFTTKGYNDALIMKFSKNRPLQSDTSDAVFSIIMPEPVIKNNDIDMGQMIVGSTKDTVVSSVICNVGDAPLHVLGVDVSGVNGGDFLIPRGAGDFFLNKGECQVMMIEFTPSALGNRTAVATIRTTIGDFKDTIHIRGVGINPVIEATAEVVDFGVFELGQGKDTTVILVKNVGSTDITITDTRISGPDMEQFSLLTAPVSYTIAAGQEKTFTLNYTAKYGGKSNSFLDFHYEGIGSPIRSLLFAEGIGGEVYPRVADAYVGETVELGIFLGKIKPEGLSEVATNYSATISYNSTLLAPIDKAILVSSEDNKSYIKIAGKLSGVSQIAAVPMKVGLGTAIKSGLVITEFQLYDAKGDSVDYDIEPGVGEFNVLGICEEGGKRLLNPNGEEVAMQVIPESNSGNARVQLTLIETGHTELIIYDQIGNKIETIYSGTPSIGSQEINLELSNYAIGRYYIKLTTPTITKTEIIEVVR